MNPNNKAYQYSIRLLALRDYSRFKLGQKLKLRGHSQEEIDKTLNELVQKGYLKEERYAESRIKALVAKGHSAQFIKQKLEKEKIYLDLTSIEKMGELDHLSQIKRLLLKKLKQVGPWKKDWHERKKQQDKVLRYLISKGHDFNQCKKALDKYSQSDVNDAHSGAFYHQEDDINF